MRWPKPNWGRFETTDAVWLCWLGSFLPLELTGLLFGPTGVYKRGKVGWTTLSEWSWDLQREFSPFQVLFFVGLAALLVHIVRWGWLQETA